MAKETAAKSSIPDTTTEPAESKDVCFVIMPFGRPFDSYFHKVYKPAIEACNLKCVRADSLFKAGPIIGDIWEMTKQAKLIVAELTGQNPNVFYELGLAHAIAKPAVLISETTADIPFDLKPNRALLYDKDDPEWGEMLKQKLISTIGETLAAPLSRVVPEFLNVDQTQENTVSLHDKELLEIKQELDNINAQLRGDSYRWSAKLQKDLKNWQEKLGDEERSILAIIGVAPDYQTANKIADGLALEQQLTLGNLLMKYDVTVEQLWRIVHSFFNLAYGSFE